MYRFSRAMYRDLAPEILKPPVCPDGAPNHERVLAACEAAVVRLATDPHYFAHPSRTLFADVRVYFPISSQQRVYRVVDTYLRLCREWLIAQPATGFDPTGHRLECRATTRKGQQCQRAPLPRNGYCPSHQHLAEPALDRELVAA